MVHSLYPTSIKDALTFLDWSHKSSSSSKTETTDYQRVATEFPLFEPQLYTENMNILLQKLNLAIRALVQGEFKEVLNFLKEGIPVKYAIIDEKGNTFLHIATEKGVFEVIRYLVERSKVPIDSVNCSGQRPIHGAIAKTQIAT